MLFHTGSSSTKNAQISNAFTCKLFCQLGSGIRTSLIFFRSIASWPSSHLSGTPSNAFVSARPSKKMLTIATFRFWGGGGGGRAGEFWCCYIMMKRSEAHSSVWFRKFCIGMICYWEKWCSCGGVADRGRGNRCN